MEIDSEWLQELCNGEKVLTRRQVLAFIMSQYDPLGHLAHFLLSGKVMLRKLYGRQMALGWDDPLPRELQQEWASYISEAVRAPPVRVPRRILHENRGQFWIVGFWDGSLEAQACVLYSRVQLRDQWGVEQGIDTRLMFAKTRVAPLDGCTIAKMEL